MQIKRIKTGEYKVTSETGGVYIVELYGSHISCTCKGFVFVKEQEGSFCKHINAVINNIIEKGKQNGIRNKI